MPFCAGVFREHVQRRSLVKKIIDRRNFCRRSFAAAAAGLIISPEEKALLAQKSSTYETNSTELIRSNGIPGGVAGHTIDVPIAMIVEILWSYS
jgi:hypothetical protein